MKPKNLIFHISSLLLFLSSGCSVPVSTPTAIPTAIPTTVSPTTNPPPVLSTQPENNTSGSTSAPVILLLTSQKGSVGDIYTWNIASQSLKQLTSWGYNSAPRVSPDGKWLAYLSMSKAAVSAMTQGQAMNVYTFANIWLLNPYTEEAIRIADQPQDATYASGDLISRQGPVWSPDGTSVAWIESDVHGERVAIYALSSKSTTTFPLNLPPGCCEGATPTLYFGRSGIAITNQEGTPTHTDEVIYVFDTLGQQLAKIASGENFHFYLGWITDGNNEYLGGHNMNGVLTVVDSLGNHQLIIPQGYPEMYNPNAPDGLSAYSVKYPSQWAITRHGQKLAEINDIWAASDISIAPDGQGIVYQQKVEAANVPGGKVFAYIVNGQTVPIIPQLRILAVTWGATAWRIHN
jgi:Tol biopolymer transport system component